MSPWRGRLVSARLARAAVLLALLAALLAGCATATPEIEKPATARPDPTVTAAG